MPSSAKEGDGKFATQRTPNMAAMAMAREDEHAHSSPTPVIVSVSTTDRAVMSQPVVGADPAVGLHEATPRTSGSGVDGQSVNRHGPAGGHVAPGQHGQLGHSELTDLRPLHTLLNVRQSDRDFDQMTSQLQEAAQDIQDREKTAKSQSSWAGSHASDKYPRKAARASTPKATRPPVLVVSPQSDIRKVEVRSKRSRSPRATRGSSRSPRRSPRRRSPRRSPSRSYGEHRRNRSPNRRRRDSPRRRDDRSRRGRESHRAPSSYDNPPRPYDPPVRQRSPQSFGRRHYPSPRGDTALNVQHREFRSSHSERLQREEGAQPEVAISQRKAKKKSRDKERITKFRQKKQEEALAQQYGQETFGPAYHGPHEDQGPHFFEVPIPEGRKIMEYPTDQPPSLPEFFSVPVRRSQAPATIAALPPGIPDQPTAQAPQSGPEEPPAPMPAWLASFTDVLTGLSNRLQFHQPPHPPHLLLLQRRRK